MLNWTTGFRNLEYAVELCEIKTVLSSYRFLSQADTVDLGTKIDQMLVLLEKLRKSIPLTTKLKGLFLSFKPAKALVNKLTIQAKADDPAVIIFTSGTETLPKGVPLSHRNLLSNQIAALQRVVVKSTDVFYSVLPPFHSFGFSVTGLLTLLAGIKTCYAPDPTKSRSMAKDIEEWKATIFCCAPSFIKALLHVAKEGQLNSLRLIVSGAEKTPQDLFDNIQAKGINAMEGYGISECSPVVTTDIEGQPHKGVGKPINGVQLCIIDPETEAIIEDGKDGEVCIAGPNVFNGYLGIKKDPFILLKGKKWYRSGDRGHLDPDGTLILTGRLKRFVKIGGEMVSLGGLEDDLLQICIERKWLPEKSELPQLATGVKDREGEKPQIILFSIVDLNRDEINRALKDLGHGSIVKVSEVRKVDAIPVTATGKVQYRALDDMIK
jgi:long-chain-fatty-acid--[acyl-carrier-protein] ligase